MSPRRQRIDEPCTVDDCACQHHDIRPRTDTPLTERDIIGVGRAFGVDPLVVLRDFGFGVEYRNIEGGDL